jgi:hypothetical protein
MMIDDFEGEYEIYLFIIDINYISLVHYLIINF